MVIFLIVTPRSLVAETDVLEEYSASFFKIEVICCGIIVAVCSFCRIRKEELKICIYYHCSCPLYGVYI
jgi:hypothetical protein